MALASLEQESKQLEEEVRYHKRIIRQHRNLLREVKERYKRKLEKLGIQYAEGNTHGGNSKSNGR